MSNFYRSFYINIGAFVRNDTFLNEVRVRGNTYLRFQVQLPISDSSEIIGWSEIPLNPTSRKNIP